MLHMLRRFYRDDSGATSIEYGLICAGIAVALITIIQSMGGDLVALLTKLFDVL
jgi:pilus assembly protein Flp/PilA